MKSLITIAAVLSMLGIAAASSPPEKPQVRLETSAGQIIVELDATAAPKTVANFLAYVRDGYYDNTIFHRVIKNFMIQGGGFSADMQSKPNLLPILNEADNVLKNNIGTIAMARLPGPHTANSQFFINVKDNYALNHTAMSESGWGYCVFGRVISGMQVVHAIENVPTTVRGIHSDVPVTAVVLIRATVITAQSLKKPGKAPPP